MICKTINTANHGLKSQIFITAGQRPADKPVDKDLCLKGRTKQQKIVLPFRQRLVSLNNHRSLTCGYENQAFQAKNQKLTTIELTIKRE